MIVVEISRETAKKIAASVEGRTTLRDVASHLAGRQVYLYAAGEITCWHWVPRSWALESTEWAWLGQTVRRAVRRRLVRQVLGCGAQYEDEGLVLQKS